MVGDLLVLITSVKHQERNPVDLVDHCQLTLKLLEVNICLTAVGGRSLILYSVEEVFYRLVYMLPVLHLPVTVNVGITHDRRRPALEVGAHCKLVPVLISPEGCFLNQILGIFVVAGKAESESEKDIFEAAHLGHKLLIGHT